MNERQEWRWVETEWGWVMAAPHISDAVALAFARHTHERKAEEVRQAAIARRKGKYRRPR